jgi:hypothetical protein
MIITAMKKLNNVELFKVYKKRVTFEELNTQLLLLDTCHEIGAIIFSEIKNMFEHFQTCLFVFICFSEFRAREQTR